MSATGTAVYFLGVGQPLETRAYPLPDKLDPRAVLVRTRIATVCGSDMYSWRGRRPFPTPSVLGHEGVGVIERMGPSIERDAAGQKLAVGDRVTWTIMATCGQCVFCRVYGLPQKCLKLFKYGHSVSDVPPYFLGTFGEYVKVTSAVHGQFIIYPGWFQRIRATHTLPSLPYGLLTGRT